MSFRALLALALLSAAVTSAQAAEQAVPARVGKAKRAHRWARREERAFAHPADCQLGFAVQAAAQYR